MKRFLCFFFWVFPALGAPDGALPQSWFYLPEDGAYQRQDIDEERGLRDKAADSIERTLRANSEALEGVYQAETTDPRLTESRGDWSFAAMMLDLSLSASGILGVMVAKGEATAQLYWRRAQSSRDEGVLGAEDDSDLAFNGRESRAEVEAKLEPVIRAGLATHEVTDGAAFRKNLLEVVLRYQTLLQKIAFNPDREWDVSKLRLDFSVDLSGKVNPAVTVGAALRLRFEWEPVAGARAVASTEEENLSRLLSSLSEAMRGLPYPELTPTGYQLKSVKFGLGMFGDGKFALVKAGASVMGHLYLARKAFTHPVLAPEGGADTVPLIEIGERFEHRAYARSLGIATHEWRSRGERGTVYEVPKAAFRKGMEQALRLGAFLAERASHSQGKHWELYQLKTEFALSLSGSVGLVNLGGTGAAEMSFSK